MNDNSSNSVTRAFITTSEVIEQSFQLPSTASCLSDPIESQNYASTHKLIHSDTEVIEAKYDNDQHPIADNSDLDLAFSAASDASTICYQLSQALTQDSLATHATAHPSIPSLFDIANHTKIARSISRPNRSTFISVMRILLTKYIQSADEESRHLAFVELMALPSKALKIHRGGRNKKNKKNKNKQQLNQLQDYYQQLGQLPSSSAPHPRDPLECSASHVTRSQSVAKSTKLANDKISRALTLLSNSYVSKASNLLVQEGDMLNASDPIVRSKLKDLHPVNPNPLPQMPPTQHIELIQIDHKQSFLSLLRSCDNGSAPGLSGWTASMILTCCTDEFCLLGFMRLVQDIINGELPRLSRDYLLSCNLISISKPGSNGIRPIAIGEILYRFATKWIKSRVSESLPAVFEPIQLGITTRNGCETIIHQLQHLLTDESQTLGAVTIDFKNAFNSISRAKVLREVYNNPALQPLWHLVNYSYSSPSLLLTRNHDGVYLKRDVLHSTQGVRQGDPLGSLLFALAVQPLYSELQETNPSVRLAAFHDDLTLVGEPNELLNATLQLNTLAKHYHLELQPSKCSFIYFHQDLLPVSRSILQRFDDLNIPFVNDATVILGAPIGKDEESVTSAAKSIIIEQCKIFQKLQNQHIPAQHALYMMRISSCHKLDYLLRCLGPVVMQDFARNFDKIMTDTALIKLGLLSLYHSKPPSIQHQVQNQLHFKLSHGGFGLTSALDRVSSAYLGSLASSLQAVTNLDAFLSPLSHASMLETRIKSSLTSFTSLVPSSKLLPKHPSQFYNHYRRPSNITSSSTTKSSLPASHELQKSLCKEHLSLSLSLRKDTFELSTTSKIEKARILSTLAPGANDWLLAVPSLPPTSSICFNSISSLSSSSSSSQSSTYLTNAEFRFACRYRLGIQFNNIETNDCFLCHRKNAFVQDPWHHLSCTKRLGGSAITHRHHAIRNVLVNFAQQIGSVTQTEPQHCFESSEERPDALIILGGQRYLVDVSVVCPTNPSNVGHGQKMLGAAALREKEKNEKYEQQAAAIGAEFVPFVMEVTGALGEAAVEFINALSVYSQQHSVIYSSREFGNSIRAALACTIHRGNAWIAASGRTKTILSAHA